MQIKRKQLITNAGKDEEREPLYTAGGKPAVHDTLQWDSVQRFLKTLKKKTTMKSSCATPMSKPKGFYASTAQGIPHACLLQCSHTHACLLQCCHTMHVYCSAVTHMHVYCSAVTHMHVYCSTVTHIHVYSSAVKQCMFTAMQSH